MSVYWDDFLDNQEKIVRGQDRLLSEQRHASRMQAGQAAAQIAQQERMVRRMETLTREARAQTQLQHEQNQLHQQQLDVQQAALQSQQNYQFKMWLQSPQGAAYQRWTAEAGAFLAFLDALVAEFAAARSADAQTIKERLGAWTTGLRAIPRPPLLRLRGVGIALVLVLAILLGIFFPAINGGGYTGLSQFITIVFGWIVAVFFAFAGSGGVILLHGLLEKREAVRVVEQQVAADAANQGRVQNLDAEHSLYTYYFDDISRDDFIQRARDGHLTYRPNTHRFIEDQVARIRAQFEAFQQQAPSVLPVQFPPLQMPAAVDPASAPTGSGAQAFLRMYAEGLRTQAG